MTEPELDDISLLMKRTHKTLFYLKQMLFFMLNMSHCQHLIILNVNVSLISAAPSERDEEKQL